ncbi:ribonuclease toxin immunity protein CdiI [Pseudomonas sp. BCA13]|uniref:ribonuclease toxin immunity protein CdiI n=2 Tax=Pseudomonas TaxID=286 RepID=UPI002114464E|nr:ribonuclease toxin immunity protein CdiI [Pseudomonas sp. BCA13]
MATSLKRSAISLRGGGFSTDGAYCNFPDENSPFNEENFEGVEFAYCYPPKDEDIVVVSEVVCSEYIRLACEKYLQHHPEDAEKVKELLDKISFWFRIINSLGPAEAI